jgi:SAM-dependent methyltransferase
MTEKRNEWFVNYHDRPEKPGLRKIRKRVDYFRRDDFQGKTVIDLGCNSGQMCEYAIEMGAISVHGVDYDRAAIVEAESESERAIHYTCDDLDNYLFYNSLRPYDTTLLLSVIGTVELTNRYGILSRMSGLTKETMYLEGHHNSIYETLVEDITKYTDFKTIEYLGLTYDNDDDKVGRPFFRLSKIPLSPKDAVRNLVRQSNDPEVRNIAVIGRAGCGKTTIRNELIRELGGGRRTHSNPDNDNEIALSFGSRNLTIMDDIYYKSSDRIFLFDYRALEYFHKAGRKVDAIYFVTCDDQNRVERIGPSDQTPIEREDIYGHSPSLEEFNFKKFYVIRT